MFPKCVPIEDELNKQLMKDFHGEKTGFCRVGPEKWVLPSAFMEHGEKYFNLPLRKDDLFVITFPRSGTTLCQELTWMVNNNMDFETSAKLSLQDRFPFLEVNTLIHDKHASELIEINNNPEITEMVQSWKIPGDVLAEKMASPRHFKTHLPFSLLPPKLLDTCKVVYVARNPKDVAVSYYHHNRLVRLHDYKNDFKQYWQYFKNDLLVFSPYWKHIEEAWDRRNHPNLLFLYYEDMIKDLKGTIRRVAKFLAKEISEEQVNKLSDALQIDNFRKSVKLLTNANLDGFVNNNEEDFIRKGKVGDHKEFDHTLSMDAEKWIKENLMRNKIYPFPI